MLSFAKKLSPLAVLVCLFGSHTLSAQTLTQQLEEGLGLSAATQVGSKTAIKPLRKQPSKELSLTEQLERGLGLAPAAKTAGKPAIKPINKKPSGELSLTEQLERGLGLTQNSQVISKVSTK